MLIKPFRIQYVGSTQHIPPAEIKFVDKLNYSATEATGEKLVPPTTPFGEVPALLVWGICYAAAWDTSWQQPSHLDGPAHRRPKADLLISCPAQVNYGKDSCFIRSRFGIF